MRILHVSSVYPPEIVGGAEKVVAMLAEHQALAGHTVAAAYLSRDKPGTGMRDGVVTLPQPNRNLLWMEDVFASPRLLRTANKLGQLVNARASRDFAQAIAEFQPDVVHTHSMVELPPMIWARAGGAAVVHTLHDYDLVCSRASLFRNGHNCAQQHPACRLAAQWKARWARRITAVAAVSAPVLATHRRFGLFEELPAARAAVIWNAVNPPPVITRAARTGDFTFGFLGRLVPEKGLDILIDACHQLPLQGWRLRIAGRAQEGDAAYRARAAGLPVEFLGFTDAAAFLQSIDVLVVPSVWQEPFGLTVIEALAAGVPVIGSRLGAIPDLMGADGDNWLVPPGNIDALAARMGWAIQSGRGVFPPTSAHAPLLRKLRPERMVAAYDTLYAAACDTAAGNAASRTAAA